MPNLRIRDAGREYTYQIDGDAAVVGRGESNDIDLEDPKTSKEHFRIERVGQRWKLVDLESKNGTKVNGEYRNKAWLGHGDLVQVGTAELRFGLEARGRAAAPPKEGEEGEEEEAPPRRYARKSSTPVLVSLTSLGLLLVILLSIWVGGGSNNALVFKRAEELVEMGQWAEAIQYMEQYGEPEEDDYVMIERRLAELRERKAAHDRNTRNEEAKAILSKVGLLIRSYNAGHVEASGPDKILPLMRQLREKYADTEFAEAAKKEWPAWYAGKVPQSASELLGSGGRVRKDWEAAVERSETFRKDWLFREAEEAVKRFVTEREAVLDQDELETFRQLRDDELLKISRMAEGIYHGRESEAERLLKNKRYDDAIAAYRQVVEKFGIDVWVRRAQSEIAKIEKMKSGGG